MIKTSWYQTLDSVLPHLNNVSYGTYGNNWLWLSHYKVIAI